MDPFATTAAAAATSAQRRDLRACANCSHAKAKCVPSNELGGRCQRCERLLKICEPTVARARPPPRKRKTPETTRVAKSQVEKLEEKLDGLVTLIRSAQETGLSAGLPLATASGSSSNKLSSTLLSTVSTHDIPLNPFPTWEDDQNYTKPQPSIPSSDSPYTTETGKSSSNAKSSPAYQLEVDEFDLGSEDPDVLLTIFRDEMSPSFPFITMTEFSLAADLRRDRPSLYTAIMAVTTRDTARGKALGQSFLKQLAERMVVNGERNMDLLLACLVFVTWCHALFHRGHYITQLLGSAMIIASDLGLNRPTYGDTPGPVEHLVRKFSMIPDFIDSKGTLEERRAYLGYFYLCSIFCQFGRRLDIVPWTPYLEECCRILSSPGSSRQDKSAAMLARIQMVAQRLGQNPWEGRPDFTGNAPPPLLYFKSLETQIQKLKEQMDPVIKDQTIIIWTFHNAEILATKIGMSKSPAVSSFPDRDFDRLQYLCACLAAVRAFSEHLLTISPAKYHTLTAPMALQIIWNTSALYQLSSFEHPDWSVDIVSEAVDFLDFLQTLANNFSMAKNALGYDVHSAAGLDFWSHHVHTISMIISALGKGNVGQPEHEGGNPGVHDQPAVETPTYSTFPPGVEFMDFMDDVWMQTSDSYQKW